ncbi:MAG: alpha/beta hydrolase [Alphaproteobacteria bacterium]|nr:alpha/beta hydrolase [Alphaproteobacteria bacterium]
MRIIKNTLFLAMAIYLGALAYYIVCQRNYIYFPSPKYVTLEDAAAPAAFEELKVTTEDHVSLTGWYARSTRKPYTIVLFHGSGDSLHNFAPLAEPYIDAGYGFLIAEYRGYSGMPGEPTENGLYADARAFVGKLFDTSVELDHIILMGHSLGAAVATQMAKEFHPAGLVLLAPFASLPQRAAELYPYFPTDFVVLDRYANDKKIPLINMPLLIAHGDKDTMIPIHHGRILFDLAKEPKMMQVLEGFGHNNMIGPSTPYVLDWLSTFPTN